MIEVIKAEYLAEYKISVLFNTGEKKEIDLSDSLIGPVFQPLKNPEYFKTFKINFNTIEWENGADFAPEYLYQLDRTETPLEIKV